MADLALKLCVKFYNMTHKDTEQMKSIKRFLAMNPSTGKHLDKAQETGGASADESEGDSDSDSDSEIEEDIMKQSERVTQFF